MQAPLRIAARREVAGDLPLAAIEGSIAADFEGETFLRAIGRIGAARQHTQGAAAIKLRGIIFDVSSIEQRRCKVGHMHRRGSQTLRGDPRPGHDHRHAQAPFAGVELVEIERGRGNHRPFRPDRRQAAGLAEVFGRGIEAFDQLDPVQCQIGETRQVGPGGFRAVVRGDHDDGVLKLASLGKVIEQAADMEIGRGHHPGIDLHLARRQRLFFGR